MTGHPREAIEVLITARNWQQSEGDYQSALLRALERDTRSQWRVVCANIFVERVEPYRTLVLRREVLETLRAQQHLFREQTPKDIAASNCPEMFQVEAELHTPLIEDTHAGIMRQHSAHLLDSAF